jgi:GNAT superfamily N-acetyltransferase
MGVNAALAIRELAAPAEWRLAWPVMRELRPNHDESSFLAALERQSAAGYRLAALLDGEAAIAVAGFRHLEMLWRGPMVYVDDLVTREDRRGTGAGTVLFDWLVAEARRLGCVALHLDSGVQRHGAHAFYFARGMHIAAHHFALDLTR